ncbi:chemotaxis protein CheW [Yangia mangrovi]|uniref:Chemotaxis protein CheW n=1 Tax=Alloyangia mangrovi TaxID=1779329 RepID=A0A2A3JVV5_9RHOB|nr:chemotaxis protein CheW [Alloyangia mangrovi]MCA0939625.1 chemotaxis protein CheW [Alloyangia pacifica]MCA0943330.1 chemotaxis protein CheW [Alloyangia pacifica]MCT4371830.1 chemotaxis protein CheW [Alloyangia mangrovi]
MNELSTLRPGAETSGRDVVTFRLGGELLAIRTANLREVLEPGAVTRVPNASPFAAGLINVRGAVVPLCDLRIPLRMPVAGADTDTRVLVLDLELGGVASTVGVIAERVHEVTRIETAALEEVPDVGSRWPAHLVSAVGRRGDEFLIIPDLDAIFSAHLGGAGPASANTA